LRWLPLSPWGEGARRADEGAFGSGRKVAPLQFGRMTYGLAIRVRVCGSVNERGRKSWPHVLSPEGRGGTDGRVYEHIASGGASRSVNLSALRSPLPQDRVPVRARAAAQHDGLGRVGGSKERSNPNVKNADLQAGRRGSTHAVSNVASEVRRRSRPAANGRRRDRQGPGNGRRRQRGPFPVLARFRRHWHEDRTTTEHPPCPPIAARQ
jgi:hypothetical protein